MKWMKQQRIDALTLTELLVVLVIISILATAAVPTYINQSSKAKRATAQSDVRQIAEAMERCGVTHNFYVPIQLLDDIAGDSSVAGISSDDDAIGNEPSTVKLIDYNVTISFLDSATQLNMGNDDTSARVENLINGWEGPFLAPQRVFMNNKDYEDLTGNDKIQDYPLDPWGQPYRFYSPIGIIGASATSEDSTSWAQSGFSDGELTSTDDRFERWAIVSFGPDGLSDTDPDALDDDIFYVFGSVETGF